LEITSHLRLNRGITQDLKLHTRHARSMQKRTMEKVFGARYASFTSRPTAGAAEKSRGHKEHDHGNFKIGGRANLV